MTDIKKVAHGLEVIKYGIQYHDQNIAGIKFNDLCVNINVDEAEILSNILQNLINEYKEKDSAKVLYYFDDVEEDEVPF